MAAPAEVSEKRSNFRIRQFKEKRLFNIAANLTLNTMASFVILLTARTARIACVRTYRQTDRQTNTRDNYCNPLCACAPRVNYRIAGIFRGVKFSWIWKIFQVRGKNFVVSCTRALMSVARCIYMVTASWVNISWFTSQPRKPRKF